LSHPWAEQNIRMIDIDETMMKKAMDGIEWSLNKMEEKGKLKEPKKYFTENRKS